MDTTERDLVESELHLILHKAKEEQSYLTNEQIADAIMLALEKEDVDDIVDILASKSF